MQEMFANIEIQTAALLLSTGHLTQQQFLESLTPRERERMGRLLWALVNTDRFQDWERDSVRDLCLPVEGELK